MRSAARARVRVRNPWMASRYSAARRVRARLESDDDARRREWQKVMKTGTTMTATPRITAGATSTAAASSMSTSRGAAAAARVGARKV